jgi:hypothetical protein
MLGLSSYLVSRVMVASICNVHYYERYVNLEIRGARLPLPANRSPSPASPGRKCSPAQMQAHPTSSRLLRSTPGNKGAYAVRRVEGDAAHYEMYDG